MANHGYVYTKKSVSDEELLKMLEEINDKIFAGTLDIQEGDGYDERAYYFITSKHFNENYDAVEVWISDEKEYGYAIGHGDFVEYDKPKIIGERTVVEFRHGHRSEVFWWLEGVFRENIADKLNGLVGDDGYEEREKPRPEKFKTFEDYLNYNPYSGKAWKSYSKDMPVGDITYEQAYNNFMLSIRNRQRKDKLTEIIKK